MPLDLTEMTSEAQRVQRTPKPQEKTHVLSVERVPSERNSRHVHLSVEVSIRSIRMHLVILSFPQSFIRSDTRNNLLKKLTNKRNH